MVGERRAGWSWGEREANGVEFNTGGKTYRIRFEGKNARKKKMPVFDRERNALSRGNRATALFVEAVNPESSWGDPFGIPLTLGRNA